MITEKQNIINYFLGKSQRLLFSQEYYWIKANVNFMTHRLSLHTIWGWCGGS